MDESLPSGANLHAAPKPEALPMTEAQQTDFEKKVRYWSETSDDSANSVDLDQALELSGVRGRSMKARTRGLSKTGMEYTRDNTTVICESADDWVSLRVENRQQKDIKYDQMRSRTYTIDGADREVIDREWLIDRRTGKPVRQEEDVDIEAFLDSGSEQLDLMRQSESDSGETQFTQGHAWDADRIFDQLEADGWSSRQLA